MLMMIFGTFCYTLISIVIIIDVSCCAFITGFICSAIILINWLSLKTLYHDSQRYVLLTSILCLIILIMTFIYRIYQLINSNLNFIEQNHQLSKEQVF